MHKMIKAFLAGLAFPSVFLPFAYSILYIILPNNVPTHPIQFVPLYIPILFGITNMIYVGVGDHCPVPGINNRLWTTGAILGFLVALIGIFVFRLPTIIFGFTGIIQYLPIILLPIIYGAIFRYIVKWLNRVLDI